MAAAFTAFGLGLTNAGIAAASHSLVHLAIAAVVIGCTALDTFIRVRAS